jgi:hypothetical protein
MSNLAVANTILEQLGGAGRLTAMIGAKNFVGDENSLQFGFTAKSKNKANKIVIRLMPDDTYKVTFWTVRGVKFMKGAERFDVYADSLRSLIESETGLYLSL